MRYNLEVISFLNIANLVSITLILLLALTEYPKEKQMT